jgi:hypothetical protein
MPTFFACPCSLKKLGGSEYVPILPLYISMPLKKLGEGRHVPVPLDGKLIIKLFEDIKI